LADREVLEKLETVRAENLTAGNLRKDFKFMRKTTAITTVRTT
jgi:hypothetical protein